MIVQSQSTPCLIADEAFVCQDSNDDWAENVVVVVVDSQ